MKDVMVDLETMGMAPDGAICAIGACLFDIQTGEIGQDFSCTIHLNSSVTHGMSLDPNTITWWLSQSNEAREKLFHDVRSLDDALYGFAKFCPGKFSLWSHATFDAVILDSAYKYVGIKRPWHYRDVRDIRTLTYLWKTLTGQSTPPQKERKGAHIAVEDAIHQAKYCSKMYNDIKAIQNEKT